MRCGEGGDAPSQLLSLNARALPPKLDAGELMALLRGNPRYMLSPVDACLWRPKLARQQGVAYAVAGFRSAAAGASWKGRCSSDAAEVTAADVDDRAVNRTTAERAIAVTTTARRFGVWEDAAEGWARGIVSIFGTRGLSPGPM